MLPDLAVVPIGGIHTQWIIGPSKRSDLPQGTYSGSVGGTFLVRNIGARALKFGGDTHQSLVLQKHIARDNSERPESRPAGGTSLSYPAEGLSLEPGDALVFFVSNAHLEERQRFGNDELIGKHSAIMTTRETEPIQISDYPFVIFHVYTFNSEKRLVETGDEAGKGNNKVITRLSPYVYVLKSN